MRCILKGATMKRFNLADLCAIPTDGRKAFVTHNKKDHAQLAGALPPQFPLRTLASMGREALVAHCELGRKEDDDGNAIICAHHKIVRLIDKFVRDEPSFEEELKAALQALLAECHPTLIGGGWQYKWLVWHLAVWAKKNAIQPADKDALGREVRKMTLDGRHDPQQLVNDASQVLNASLPQKGKLEAWDYMDLVWLPVILGIPLPAHSHLAFAEGQEWTVTEWALLTKWERAGAELISIPDAPY
jgi:hypothetical protein